jgi:muramoyltetrapeptide carboxypeptidase
MIKIKKGDIVDIVAPASFSNIEEIEVAKKVLSTWGLVARFHINFDVYHPFHSDEDEVRLNDLKRAILATDSKIIWCLRGGYGSARLLMGLAKMSKPKNEKLLIGFSDITSLHTFVNQAWNWKSILGPTISSFSNKKLSKVSLLDFKKIFFVNKNKRLLKLKPLNDRAHSLNKDINGVLAGGTLAIIQTTLGTPFQIDLKNKILVLEDVGERGYRVDRMLNHLVMSGVLKNVKAIIFGDFTGGEESNGANFVEFAIMRFALLQKVPVFKTNEFGHGKINRPLVLNKKSKILNLLFEN